jgi:hypothetical protein
MPEDSVNPEGKGKQRPLWWRVVKGVSLWLFRLALLVLYGAIIWQGLRELGYHTEAVLVIVIPAFSLIIAGFKSRFSFDWILVLLLLVELALVQGTISMEWASAPLPIVWIRVLVVQAVLFLVFFVSSSIYRAVKKQFHYSLFATELMVLAYYGVMLRPLGIVLI